MRSLMNMIKKEMIVHGLKVYSKELLQSNAFKEGFVKGFNEAVDDTPELVITMEELNQYICLINK